MKNLGIDFDGTLSDHPAFFRDVCDAAKRHDVNVFLITARRPTDENREIISEFLKEHNISMPVLFTALGSKLAYVERMGLKIHWWWDDDPEKLVHGH